MSRYSGFFLIRGRERGFQMTAKDTGFGDKNVSLNKQIVTAEMEDVYLLLVYF